MTGRNQIQFKIDELKNVISKINNGTVEYCNPYTGVTMNRELVQLLGSIIDLLKTVKEDK